MNTAFLYRYLTAPFKQTAENLHYTPKYEALLVMILLGMTCGAEIGGKFFIILGFLFTLLGMGMIFIQSLIFDFTAQLFHYPGQSLRAYHWLCLSNLPLLIKLPLFLLSGIHTSLSIMTSLVALLAFFMSLSLHIFSLKHLYQMSTRKAIFIYFLPMLVIVGLIGCLVTFTSVISIFFIKSLPK
jgi:hypothetical protein